jgi:NAD(P)H-flavin reductase
MTTTASCVKGKASDVKVAAIDPMRPRPFRVEEVTRDLPDTVTMVLKPEDGGRHFFMPGQFNMLYVYGIGEVPISISGDPMKNSILVHTTRAVGEVSRAIDNLKTGEVIGVRGPYGTHWPLAVAEGMDLVFVAGGIGLAPLRPAIYQAMEERHKFNNISILYGARTAEDLLFVDEVAAWRKRFDIDVLVTVDKATGNWRGRVGVVPKLVAQAGFDAKNTAAFTCGPEIMMHYAAKALQERGIPDDRMFLSMERNMKCGVGLCGHCQWGTSFVCRDGPVFRYDQIVAPLAIKEL